MTMTEPQDISQLTPADWYRRFVYVISDDCFYDVETQREYSRQAFNAIYRGVPCFSIHNKQRRIEAATAFDENRAALGSRVLQGLTFAPGESPLIAKADGSVYANRWRNARPKGKPGDATPWLRHAERMLPEDMEREHVLDVMAYKVQNPNRKINHAILHCGLPGSGKDSLWAPFFWSIGGDSLNNVVTARADDVVGQWGYALESEIVILNELREPNRHDRLAMENYLKPIIAAPPEFLQVNRKGLHPYPALNRMLVVAFSNEQIPIAVSAEDRRWFVTWSQALRMEDDAGRDLWNWYKAGGFAIVCNFLHERDVSQFNPGAAPPMTEAKSRMIDLSASPIDSTFLRMVQYREGPFAKGVVASPWVDVIGACGGATKIVTRQMREGLFGALLRAGWVDKGRCVSRHHPTPKTIWCAPEHADKTPTQLRIMVEEVTPLTLVK